MSAVADVLRAAADRLERTGKCEGTFRDHKQEREGVPRDECRACAAGALDDAAPVLDVYLDARQVLIAHVGGERMNAVYDWSDSHSLAEVVAGLRAAADGAA